MKKRKLALISVSDKKGIERLGAALNRLGIGILSTGGTAKALRAAGVEVEDIADYTGAPEILDGRVKTLHRKIYASILARKGDEAELVELDGLGAEPIDFVIVNLYPFEATAMRAESSIEERIENIDVGGPTMIRAAAKNHQRVAALVDPNDYDQIIAELESNDGGLSIETRRALAVKAFELLSWYDGAIGEHLRSLFKPSADQPQTRGRMSVRLEKIEELRYGENPHQRASSHKILRAERDRVGLDRAERLNGKELSYNNIVDMAAARDLVNEFDSDRVCAIIKHTNPSGVARSAESLLRAYTIARDADPLSAFGGVVAFNSTVDAPTAEELSKLFLELLIAPDYDPVALKILRGKKNLRLMKAPRPKRRASLSMKFLDGIALAQDSDALVVDEAKLRVVTKRAPTDSERAALLFNFTVAKHVKSNAIVYGLENETIGVGAGQMSRVDSAKIAALKARKPLKGAVMASDAFFPFRDAIDAAAAEGISAIIQPGGSIRDEEIIAAADEHNIAMICAGVRHFRH